MQFDHLDPTTKISNVSRLSWSDDLDALMSEMAKCELVCATCHALREARRREAEGGRGYWERRARRSAPRRSSVVGFAAPVVDIATRRPPKGMTLTGGAKYTELMRFPRRFT